jgi:NAD(P)H-quinone oxidoreductase subunit 4
MGFVLLGIASFTDVGISGAVLQMISHGLIAALLFFLTGVTYDRTHTLIMPELGGVAKAMPKVFALFTAGAMASLALPGMSGFASELSVFVGITSSDIYSSTFRTVTVFLAAVGIILTPIYLLSMLREVFYGSTNAPSCDLNNQPSNNNNYEDEAVCFGTNCVLPNNAKYNDANPREIFIALSFLVLIVAIGIYPKLATNMYDVKTVAINSDVRHAYAKIVEDNPEIYAKGLFTPKLGTPEVETLLGVVK